ncbi:MAG: DUF362 domain-containing protein, partial [Deltaproteobacteria bacterium]|nr:DUF362 domain-containing protein [Deltaproteobacteria bacterium]
IELLTNAIKNLGIGLYPMEANVSSEPGKVKWKYATPDKPTPAMKSKLPHMIWRAKIDKEKGIPKLDENGEQIWEKTDGMPGTMADVIEAVQYQDIFMLHVIDAIETSNGSQAGPPANELPEGYVFAGTDPVALDILSARYLFTNVPMAEARKIQKEENLPTDFLQKVPIPCLEDNNIVTKEGYDSPIPRYTAFKYCQERGLGREEYYVVGEDKWQGGSLVSVEQHLGRVDEGVFNELLTSQLYFAVSKPLYDLQKTTLAYIEANDKLNGSEIKQGLFDFCDENGDGVIDFTEKGKIAGYDFLSEIIRTQAVDLSIAERLRIRFLMGGRQLKPLSVAGDSGQNGFEGMLLANSSVTAAMGMSRAPVENMDPFVPGLAWGKGKWPSLKFVRHMIISKGIYGVEFPARFGAMCPYGYALCYADLKWGEGKYTGGEIPNIENDNVEKYRQALAEGAAPLPFVIYVPGGFGKSGESAIPNIEETENPNLLFTAAFDNGLEVWRDLKPSDFPYDDYKSGLKGRV